MAKQKLVLILLSVALISLSFTSKLPVKPNKPTSTIILCRIGVDSLHRILYGVPDAVTIDLYTDQIESVWWKARVRIRMYFEGAIGHWEGTGPFRHYVLEWGWGYRTYDAEVPPGSTQFMTIWDIGEGEIVDDMDFTILSFQAE